MLEEKYILFLILQHTCSKDSDGNDDKSASNPVDGGSAETGVNVKCGEKSVDTSVKQCGVDGTSTAAPTGGNVKTVVSVHGDKNPEKTSVVRAAMDRQETAMEVDSSEV